MTTFKLHQLVRVGDTAAVQALLDEGTAVDARDGEEYTPLMRAAGSPRAGADMLQLLIEAGADVNASFEKEFSFQEETHYLARTVLREALSGGRVAKISYLLDAGADLHYDDSNDYEAMLDLCHGRDLRHDEELLPAARLLLARGAAPNPVSSYGESPLRQAVETGRFDLVELLLEAGVPARAAGWSDFVLALLFGPAEDIRSHLTVDLDLNSPDSFGFTPLHLAVLLGDAARADLLVRAGAELTRPTARGRHPATLAIQADRPEMLGWLLAQGIDPEARDDLFQQNLVQFAVTNRSPDCLELLLAAGASPRPVNQFGQKPIGEAIDLASVRLLLAAGELLSDASLEMRHAYLGLDDSGILDVTQDEYQTGKRRRYGRSNPEQMVDPFWEGMVRTRVTAWAARMAFNDETNKPGQPVWCNSRFGQTITPLGDGRFVEIGGEHEDWYDVDFCIYNEVIVYTKGQSPIIYGYPSQIFPPTDFHTATLVGEFIYIVGNLGYIEARQPGETPVYRLDTRSWRIEKVETTGRNPGWISRHEAVLIDDTTIMVSGGKVWTTDHDYVDHSGDFVLDLERLTWQRV